MSCRDAYAYGCGCVTVTLPMRYCDAIQVGDFQVATAGGVWVAAGVRLLRQGVGIKAIGDLLGHHSLEATCVYLRIDTDMLRAVALPVPGITTV